MSSYPSANNPGSRPENLTGTSSNTNNPYADPPPYQPQAGYQPAYTPAYPSYPPQSNSGVYPPSSSSGFNAAPLPPPPAGYPAYSDVGYDPSKLPAYTPYSSYPNMNAPQYQYQNPSPAGSGPASGQQYPAAPYGAPSMGSSTAQGPTTTVIVQDQTDRDREGARAACFAFLCFMGFFTMGIAWLFLWVPLLM